MTNRAPAPSVYSMTSVLLVSSRRPPHSRVVREDGSHGPTAAARLSLETGCVSGFREGYRGRLSHLPDRRLSPSGRRRARQESFFHDASPRVALRGLISPSKECCSAALSSTRTPSTRHQKVLLYGEPNHESNLLHGPAQMMFFVPAVNSTLASTVVQYGCWCGIFYFNTW